jgi:hypothetical protein
VPNAISGEAVEKFESRRAGLVGTAGGTCLAEPVDQPVRQHQPASARRVDQFDHRVWIHQYRALVAFHEPRVFNTAADGLVTAVVEQQSRSSFNLARKSITARWRSGCRPPSA